MPSDILQLQDYAALRAYAGTGELIFVTGGPAGLSGIDGMFLRDDSDTTSTDNDGTVIVGSNLKRWKRQFDGPADVRWFGAVGGGIVDDHAAIQAAMTAHLRVFLFESSFRITEPLKYRSYQEITGASKGGLAGRTKIVIDGAKAAFVSLTRDVSACFAPVFTNLTINNNAGEYALIVAGSTGIDMQHTGFAEVKNCSFRYHDTAIRLIDPRPEPDDGISGGYYNTFQNCEVSSCTIGYAFLRAANSNRIIGGRIHSCKHGIYADQCNEQFVTTAIENCETGIELLSGCSGWLVHSRFESNGDTIIGKVAINTTLGAGIVMRSGSSNNHIYGFCSSAKDRIIDQGDNFVHTKSTGYSGVAPYGRENMFLNESLEFDSDANGVADGLDLNPSIPAGTTMSLDTTTFATGTKAQLYAVSLDGTSRRDLLVDTFKTTVGVRYVFAARVRTNRSSGWNLRGGTSYAGMQYVNVPISLVDEFAVMTFSFVATSTTSFVYFYTHPSTVAGGLAEDAKLWVDSVYFGPGSKAPEFGHESQVRSKSATYDPASLVNGAKAITTITLSGVALGDYIEGVSFSNDLQGVSLNAWISAANTVSVQFLNNTGGTIDLASGTVRVRSRKQ